MLIPQEFGGGQRPTKQKLSNSDRIWFQVSLAFIREKADLLLPMFSVFPTVMALALERPDFRIAYQLL